jgi:AcrR family transcriptional regulator
MSQGVEMASLLACYLLGDDASSLPPLPSLPRRRHQLDRQTVEASQRFRMVLATARAAARKGWAQTTVADIVDAAGVSRKTFYEHFDGKDEAFVAAYDAVDVGISRVATALVPEGDVGLVLGAAMRGLLTFFAADSDFTWMLCVEANAASPAIRGRRLATVGRLASLLAGLLERGRQADPSIPVPDLDELIGLIGGINELIVRNLVDGGDLVALYPAVSRLTAAICLGQPTLDG